MLARQCHGRRSPSFAGAKTDHECYASYKHRASRAYRTAGMDLHSMLGRLKALPIHRDGPYRHTLDSAAAVACTDECDCDTGGRS